MSGESGVNFVDGGLHDLKGRRSTATAKATAAEMKKEAALSRLSLKIAGSRATEVARRAG
jgi:hypothetical protein